MVKALLAAQKRERDRVLAEMVKIKGFMPLLMKPRNGMHWAPEERRELAVQLRAAAHLSPGRRRAPRQRSPSKEVGAHG